MTADLARFERTCPTLRAPSPHTGEGFSQRLHLQAGPIDLVIQAWGTPPNVANALQAAAAAFLPILPALCTELPHLRTELPTPPPTGTVAQCMHAAVLPYARHRITPMAAVAGAVADHVLAAMTAAAPLTKAVVNNRGDIAFHLAPGQSLTAALVTDVAAPALDAAFRLDASQPTRGIATSGRACPGQGGRSFSLGIADAVTILARTAATADAAATIVANAVDLPDANAMDHPAITRVPANTIVPDSDLGARLVTWDVGPLAPAEVAAALDAGRRLAEALQRAGRIDAAILALQGQIVTCPPLPTS